MQQPRHHARLKLVCPGRPEGEEAGGHRPGQGHRVQKCDRDLSCLAYARACDVQYCQAKAGAKKDAAKVRRELAEHKPRPSPEWSRQYACHSAQVKKTRKESENERRKNQRKNLKNSESEQA